MRKCRRTRKACALDEQARLSDMEERNPGREAKERFERPAYQVSPLSLQARQLIRSQGSQLEHKSVTEYMRSRGVDRVGQEYSD